MVYEGHIIAYRLRDDMCQITINNPQLIVKLWKHGKEIADEEKAKQQGK
jgi:hypothetical protein